MARWISLTTWVGSVGAEFDRVAFVFEQLGYRRPSPLWEGSDGNYVMNIISQYLTDFSAEEVQQIIAYGFDRSMNDLIEIFDDVPQAERLYLVLPVREAKRS